MAAQEYFAQHPPPPQPASSPFLAPGPQPQRASSQPGSVFHSAHPSPNSQPQQYFNSQHASPSSQPQNYFPPPPYQDPAQKPQVHFAQSPQPQQVRPEQRNSFSHPQRPSPLQQQVLPGLYNAQYIPPFAPHNPAPWQHHAPYNSNVRPYGGVNQSQSSLSGYSSDPGEEYKRRHKHRHHHSDDTSTRRDSERRRDRKPSDTSRGSTADSLIGATGGGLIGDLIFPGLGTVGGALAGWIGGKDYARHRKHREEKRAHEQEKWERRYGTRNLSPGDYDSDRDRSRSRDRRRRSHE